MEEPQKICRKSVFDQASFLSKLSFAWMSSLFIKGWKKDLSFEDLDQAASSDEVSIWAGKLER